MAVFWPFFEHLSTGVNGVSKRDINIRNSSSATTHRRGFL
jgi:hypothetical protein